MIPKLVGTIWKDASGTRWRCTDQSESGEYVTVERLSESGLEHCDSSSFFRWHYSKLVAMIEVK